MRANRDDSGIGRTTAVGMYPLAAPAGWPVFDLAGNVWEWCVNPYDEPGKTRSKGDVSRVLRGGSWNDFPWLCRAAYRFDFAPVDRGYYVGFRVCRGSPITISGTQFRGRYTKFIERDTAGWPKAIVSSARLSLSAGRR